MGRRIPKLTTLKLVLLFDQLQAGPWQPACGWQDREVVLNCEQIARSGFIDKALPLACVAFHLLRELQPDTVRGTMYATVSAGWLTDTGKECYRRIQRILNILRQREIIPYHWIVDNIRSTEKPSLWDGLGDYVDTIQDAYRKDFWPSLPEYVCIIIEKDAAGGRIAPVTNEYDVALHPLRGFSSTTFAYTIGSHWREIRKPIHAYYIGDHDPSGRNIGENIRASLENFSRRPFHWKRLAVEPEHFDEFNIIPLKPKKTDTRYKQFVARYGERCAEVEAIPADALRGIVRSAIRRHIPPGEWDRLQQIEGKERATWHQVMGTLRDAG